MGDKTVTNETHEKLHGLLAEYESPGALIEGARVIRDAGFTRWDCHSPFPVHGIDPAMGIKPTILPVLVFGAGLTGTIGGLLMQTWMNAMDYPWMVSGKPMFSLPMQIPIIFETTVLLAAFGAFFGMWTLNRLPQPFHPLFGSDRFLRASSSGFFIAVEADDAKFDAAETKKLLSNAGATAVEEVRYQTGPAKRKMPTAVSAFIAVSIIAALVPLAMLMHARAKRSDKPRYHIIPGMDFQPKAKAQQESDFFADGRAARLPVEGTVARGELRADDHFYRGITGDQWVQTFPVQIELSRATIDRGRRQFDIYCAPCHGQSGNGKGMVNQRAEAIGAGSAGWVAPTDLTQPGIVSQPHGQLFNTIGHGIRNMKGYKSQIEERDRWAIVLYLRALQRVANSSGAGAGPANR